MTTTYPVKKLADFDILAIGNTIQLAGAIYTDANGTYLVPFPDEHDAVEKPVTVLAMNQTDWTAFNLQTDHLSVEMLAPNEDGKIVKSVVRKSQRQIDQGVSWAVYKRDGYRCRYCAIEGVPMTVDHLVLYEEGGPATVENLVTACRKCNKTRGNLSYAAWLKHPHYKKVSVNLIEFARIQNEKVADTLHLIPRVVVKTR